ncbi:MAG: acetyltransferase [Phycisphaerales bacterium]|nr:acetyltransferase [Phycisphaerales bacterium]
MRSLSNFLRRDAGDSGAAPVNCRPARPEELHGALRLILASASHGADDAQVHEFLAFAGQRNIDVNAMWVAEQNGRMPWALLPILSAGRTMLLFVPPHRPTGSAAAAPGLLIDAACEWFTGRDVQLAQVLLDPADESGQRLFETHGFARMAELIYLHGPVRRAAQSPVLPTSLSLVTYSADTHAQFAGAIAESYHESLDCPGLNGVRSIDDIVAGHKASGEFDPSWWLLLRERDAMGLDVPLGVLLLSRLPRSDTAELVYLGLTPAARGRGLGDTLMRQAFALIAQSPLQRLSLAVDSGNAPALKLYYRYGMSRIGSKIAMMRKLN